MYTFDVIITLTRLCNILRISIDVKTIFLKMKKVDRFLIFAQNIDCGYTIEPPQ